MPPAPGPSWRGSAETPNRGNVRSWRRPGAGSSTSLTFRSPWIRSLVSFLSALVAIASIILFIFLVFVPGCTQTRFVVLSPAPYSDAGLPPHPFAQREREDFRTRFSAESLPELIAKGQTRTEAPKRATTSADSRRVLVLYVTALTGRYDSGVVIYSDDSGPDEPEGYLPLDRLWEFLEKLPHEQKKILALDLSRGPIDWRWGQLTRAEPGSMPGQHESHDRFQSALSRIPNLAILNATAPGEVSWSSSSLAQSVFSHFLIRGLAGEADGSGGQPRDRRITLAELSNFVLLRVNHWVSQNRDLRGQHPQLFTADNSREALLQTVVAEVRGKPSFPPAETAKPNDSARLRQLEVLWEARDQWSTKEPEQWNPLGWRQFQEQIRRAEQWWLAGQKEGMDPHLQAAEKLTKELADSEVHRDSDVSGSRFVATNLSRRTNPVVVAETEPVLPERQLQLSFQEFGPAGLPKSDYEASLQLRTRAEQQSWQSFRSRLWTGTLLLESDQARRLAEDLLFVGTVPELEKADTLRRSATTTLDRCEQITREQSEARRLLHRLLAKLPDLAWWAAQRLPVENLSSTALRSRRASLMNEYSLGIDEARFRPPSLSDQEKLRDEQDESTLQQTEIDLLLLFEQTRQLSRILDREIDTDFSFSTRLEWRDELKALKQSLTNPEQGLDALENRLTRHAKGLVGAVAADPGTTDSAVPSQTQYFHWLRLRNALQWTGLSTDLRRGLFTDLEQSDRVLHSNALKTSVATSAEWSGDNWSGVDGCWQGLWALQSLSLGSSDAAMHERWVIWKNAVVDPQKQLDLLVQLGQSVRNEYRSRVDRAQPAIIEADRLENVTRLLITAERAARTMHGYDAVLFSPDRDPVRRLREFDLGALCLAQADRYLEDFWGKVSPNDRDPWYVQAVNQCLRLATRQNDLLSIAPLRTAREDIVRRMQARQSAQLKISAFDAKVDLSLTIQRPFRVSADFDRVLPAGVAALWMDEGVDLSARKLEFLPPGRRALSAGSSTAELTARKQPVSTPGKCEEIPVHPRLLFRARYWDAQSDVIQIDPCPPKSIEREYRSPPPTGEVVVYGVDRRDTIFILDCSSSMSRPINPNNKEGDSRFQAARKALSEALRVLRDGPVIRNEKEPHVVGLMAYGHRAKVNGKAVVVNQEWKRPIPSAVAEDWRNDFEILNSADRLNDDQYARITASLDTLQPFGQTPLLGAIQSAARSLIDRKRGGVIVAITDGDFNDDSPDGPRYKSLQDVLQGHPELSLHVVAFGIGNPTEIASLKKLCEHTRGTFHNAPDGEKLAGAIEKVMKPRQFAVIREALPRQENFANLGVQVNNLSPHSYKVQFPDLPEFPVIIAGGERLEFDLDFANNSLKHRRPQPLLFRRAQDSTLPSPREPTRFGYLKADFDKTTRKADLQFCLDRDDLLSVVERPAEIRIDVAPRGKRLQLSHSWKLASAQSIPVWQFEMHDWPGDSKPVVNASWKMSRTEPDAQLALGDLMKDAQSATLPGWPEESLKVTAEKQQGKVLVRLQAIRNPDLASIGDIRIELGQQSQVESKFLPKPFNWRSQLFETQHQMTIEFDVGDDFDASRTLVALTSRNSLDRGIRILESPLVIEKWDKEQ